MDARITKQRLGNLLSYDWLKIIAAVVAAVILLTLFFTMVGTRPTQAQTFTVFCYTGLRTGSDYGTLSDSLQEKQVFSYDILEVSVQDFSTDEQYASTLFMTRRSAKEGTVMFVADVPVKDEKEGTEYSSLISFTGGIAYNGENANSGYYDTEYYMRDCRAYLETFFGADLTNEIDAAATEASFLDRNGKDKRYITSSKISAEDEAERLTSLREDYLYVSEAFAEGALAHTAYETEAGEYSFGISLRGLKKISDLVYCVSDDGVSVDPLTLMIFYNNYGAGDDLRFETVSFLRYLVENYGE